MHLSNANKILLLIFIILLAFALRLYHLDYQSFWSDEGISVLRAQQSVPEIIETLPADHVPLYFIALHYWIPLTGESDFALRLFSVLASMLVIPFIYRLGKELFNSPTGLIAALITAINPFQIYYAQETRMYAQGITFTLAAVCFLTLAFKKNRLRDWVGYALFTTLSLYTHYYTVLIPFAMVIFYFSKYLLNLATEPFPRPSFSSFMRSLLPILHTRFVYVHLIIAVLYAAWLPFILRLLQHTGWRTPGNPLKIPFSCFIAYSAGYAIPPEARYWVVIGFGLLLALGIFLIVKHLSLENPESLLVIFYLFVPIGTVVAIFLFRKPDFHPRYLSVVTPAYYLILAYSIAAPLYAVWRTPRPEILKILPPLSYLLAATSYLITFAALILYIYYSDSPYSKPDFKDVARHIEAHTRPGDGILADGPDPEKVFLRYYDGALPTYDSRWIEQRNAEDVDAYLSDLLEKHTRLWVILYFHQPAAFEHWLSQNAYIAYHDWFHGIRLYLYSAPQPDAPKRELEIGAQRANLDSPIELAKAEYHPAPVPSGKVVNLALYWRAVQPVAGDYKVSARLTDAAGHVYRQHDRRPLDGFYNTSEWQAGEIITDHYGLLLPTGTPPSEYWVEIKMYDPVDWRAIVETRLGPIEVTVSLWDPAKPPDIQYPHHISFNDRVILYGYDLPGDTVRAGDTLPITLLWRVLSCELRRDEGECNYQFQLWLENKGGDRVAELAVDVSKLTGKLVRDYFNLSVSSAVESGKCRLWLDVIDVDTGESLFGAPTVLTTLEVVSREHIYEEPTSATPLTARIGKAVELRGYAVHGLYEYNKAAFVPGDTIELTLYWKCRAAMDERYKVFVHLLDEQGQIQGQHDSEPGNGGLPTNSWVKDEILTDIHEVPIKDAAPPGTYSFAVGMYDGETGERLPAYDATGARLPDDRIILGKIAVEK